MGISINGLNPVGKEFVFMSYCHYNVNEYDSVSSP